MTSFLHRWLVAGMVSRPGVAWGLVLSLLLGAGCLRSHLPWGGLALEGADGQPQRLVVAKENRAVVFLFLGVDCPIANRALPELKELELSRGPRGVRFIDVYAQPDETWEAIREHRRQFGRTTEAYRDPGWQLAKRLAASRTPEAVALTPEGRLIYRGRVNDQYAALGVARLEPTRHDLAEALDAFLAGGAANGTITPAVGCSFRALP